MQFGNAFIFCVTTLVYQTTEDCAGFGASGKRSNRCINIPAAFHGNTRDSDYIPVYTDGSRDGNAVACATVFPSNTVISMILPDSASVFTAEVWAIIKALEQIKDFISSKYIVFTISLWCLRDLHHMKLEHPGMVIRKYLFKFCLVFVWYLAILALRAMKNQTLLPSLHWICPVPRLVFLKKTEFYYKF